MTWWASHVRPRDLFVVFATVLLAILAVVVWTAASEVSDQARAGVVGGIVTTFGTLIGYYLGNRGAESAAEEAERARARASRLDAEVNEAKALAARLRAMLGEAAEVATAGIEERATTATRE